MILYSQNDPRWKDIKIGKTPFTIGEIGCFLTSLAMIDERTPDIINTIFITDRVYDDGDGKYDNDLTDDNLIIPSKAAQSLNLTYKGILYNNPKKMCVVEMLTGIKRYPTHFALWFGNGKIAKY